MRSPDLFFVSSFLRNYQVVDELEDTMTSGGNVVDFHSCDLFPERWFDYVIVLRADNTILYDRLAARSVYCCGSVVITLIFCSPYCPLRISHSSDPQRLLATQ